ncbi:UrcA family protein [Novosphingobium soli]|uniref:UrcA family protein n=1 Tax=Novosphingobium soli TaxID=574956 RepID=A0ABV6CXA5_9SPHN
MKIGVLALASLAFATSASAATDENPFAQEQTLLQLDGLDLATAEGQQRLAIRMDQAARSVCGDRVASLHLMAERKSQDCRAAVLADIRNQIETRRADASGAAAVKFALAR